MIEQSTSHGGHVDESREKRPLVDEFTAKGEGESSARIPEEAQPYEDHSGPDGSTSLNSTQQEGYDTTGDAGTTGIKIDGQRAQQSAANTCASPIIVSTTMGKELGTVEEFKKLMYGMQAIRRKIVSHLLMAADESCERCGGDAKEVRKEPIGKNGHSTTTNTTNGVISPQEKSCAAFVDPTLPSVLRGTYEFLTDSNTTSYQRSMLAAMELPFQLNVKDEILGLEKDLRFLETYSAKREKHPNADTEECLARIDLVDLLKPYHPISPLKFEEEFRSCVKFLHNFSTPSQRESDVPENNGSKNNDENSRSQRHFQAQAKWRLPIMVTDWDGTMKDYCSQYATNLQPIYAAISMASFAKRFTRLTAVLTAGPLRGPGILDLTALPIDGPIVFSGSWGREWWLKGKRVVHDDGISEAGIDALERFNDEMRELLGRRDYAQFGLVGSGVQRKVDRLTLGVQTVCKHVQADLSNRYQDEVRERLHRVDPNSRILHFDPSTELEVEVVVKNNDVVWNKAHGVKKVIEMVGDSLDPPGRVLICGDTASDLPMVQHASSVNPEGVMTLFVGANDILKRRVSEFVPIESNRCFVSCPDVIHAAMLELIREHKIQQKTTALAQGGHRCPELVTAV